MLEGVIEGEVIEGEGKVDVVSFVPVELGDDVFGDDESVLAVFGLLEFGHGNSLVVGYFF